MTNKELQEILKQWPDECLMKFVCTPDSASSITIDFVTKELTQLDIMRAADAIILDARFDEVDNDE